MARFSFQKIFLRSPVSYLFIGSLFGMVFFLGFLFWGSSSKNPSLRYSGPLIRPDYTNFKVKASHPGGTSILHQDKEIYTKLLRTPNPSSEVEENFSSLPEEPLPFSEDISPPKSLQNLTPLPVTLESLHASQSPPLSKNANFESWTDVFENLVKEGLEESLSETPDISYHVYLAPFPTKELNQIEWKRVRAKNKILLQNLPITILRHQKADGTFQFHTQIGPFSCEQDAKKLCSSLQKNQVSCRVIQEKLPLPS